MMSEYKKKFRTGEGFQDKEIQCCECQVYFIFPAWKQEEYKAMEYKDPRRCYQCVQKRKSKIN